jgi:hypothetical protein
MYINQGASGHRKMLDNTLTTGVLLPGYAFEGLTGVELCKNRFKCLEGKKMATW